MSFPKLLGSPVHPHMIQAERFFLNPLCAPTFANHVGILQHYARYKVNKAHVRRRWCSTSRWFASTHKHSTSKISSSKPRVEENSDMSLVREDVIPTCSAHSKERNNRVLFSLFEGASNVFRADELGWEIVVIALPALLALTADPLASLVGTAFIGQLGSVELAAVGVSIAVFNLISKLLNFPVLNITTSLVAEEKATDSRNEEMILLEDGLADGSIDGERDPFIAAEDIRNPVVKEINNKKLHGMQRTRTDEAEQRSLPAVSTALIVGSALGFLELAVLVFGSRTILDIMGVSLGSDMRVPAEQYLALRAIGAPAVVVSLAVQGVFRGFKDTKTPLYATVSGNIVNMMLVPILMFSLGYGVGGAAIATVISEYLMAMILLLKLSKKVLLLPPKLSDLQFHRYLKNGGLLLARSTAVMLTMTLATSQAARQGAIPMAAHQICMQVWLATSLLADAIALAGQAIIASALARNNYDLAKDAAFRTLQMGFAFGFILSLILGVGMGTFSKVFTNDPRVFKFLALGIPFVAATQPINSVAFVFDGLHFGASDFSYAAKSMIIVSAIASFVILIASPVWGFVGVWVGLTLLMTMRMFAGFLRLGTASGPWNFLK